MEKQKGTKRVRRVYLAGPFFSDAQIANIEFAERTLADKGLSVFSPMRHEAESPRGTAAWAHELFKMDRDEIDRADAVAALYYGSDGDTGTAWECGYASARGIPVVLIHTEEGANSNIMMHCGCTTNIYLRDLRTFDFDVMPIYEFEGEML